MIKQRFRQLFRRVEQAYSRYEDSSCGQFIKAFEARARFELKKRHGIVVAIDDISVYQGCLNVVGWALTGKGADDIRAIEVSVNHSLLGQAIYGDARSDVENIFRFIRKSGQSGFHLYEHLPQGIDFLNMVVHVKITRYHGNSHIISYSPKNQYARWIRKNEPGKNLLERQCQTRLSVSPRISLITPTYNTPERFLIEMIESVRSQTYSNWELCIADGASCEPHVKEVLTRYAAQDCRIKIAFLPENNGIAGNSNEAAALATGEFLGLLDHGDTLPPFALFELAQAILAHQNADYLYSDEDLLSEDGTIRHDPRFKPDFSPDTLRSANYPTHLSVLRKSLFDDIGGFRPGFDGSQDYDLILRATERARGIVHIPKILYHQRIHDHSVACDSASKLYAYDAGQRALTEHLQRVGLAGRVERTEHDGYYKVTYDLPSTPLISIIIPNHDHADDLKRCVTSILKKSSYRAFEIVIVENGSCQRETFALYEQFRKQPEIRIIEWTQPFNYAAVNNFAANQARGEVLLFLNNDTEIITSDWIERMLEHALRPEIGAVGAKLYYPDHTIQHAGVIIGLGKIAGHPFRLFPMNHPGYMGRLWMIQNLNAVTAACLMIRKELFTRVEGFDVRYILAYNDVDLCLKVRQTGYLVVWTPYAELYHHESKTRGEDYTPEKKARFNQEKALFRTKWKDWLDHGDEYYNPNLTLKLGNFSLPMS